jgi:hypothetical protein
MQGLEAPAKPPHVERMFSIRIRAGEDSILRQLGAFGDLDREYFKPRFIKIRRTSGLPNEVGTTIRYEVPLGLSFNLGLTRVAEGRYLLYRILDGFGRGGVFAFDIDELKPGVNLLTTYVGFDFPRGTGVFSRVAWMLMRRFFPRFAHDVVWNHSLCKIKQLAEEAS